MILDRHERLKVVATAALAGVVITKRKRHGGFSYEATWKVYAIERWNEWQAAHDMLKFIEDYESRDAGSMRWMTKRSHG